MGRYLIAGSGNTYIATLVERHSRFVLLVKVTRSSGGALAHGIGHRLVRQGGVVTQGRKPDRVVGEADGQRDEQGPATGQVPIQSSPNSPRSGPVESANTS